MTYGTNTARAARTATRQNRSGPQPQPFAQEQGKPPAPVNGTAQQQEQQQTDDIPRIAAERGMTAEQWRILRKVFFPKAQNDEIVALVWDYCKAAQIDPMLRPFHIVPVWEWDREQRRLTRVDTIWPSIVKYRITAHRTGEYAGMDEPVLGPMVDFEFEGEDENRQMKTVTVQAPEWGQVTVYRLVAGQRMPFPVRLYWRETYATRGKGDLPTPMWLKRPIGQFLKCLEAAALRAAFPEVGGEPTAEEMEGRYREASEQELAPEKPTPQPVQGASPRLAKLEEAIANGTAFGTNTGMSTRDEPAVESAPVDDLPVDEEPPVEEPPPEPPVAAEPPRRVVRVNANGTVAAKPQPKVPGKDRPFHVWVFDSDGVDVGYDVKDARELLNAYIDEARNIVECNSQLTPQQRLATLEAFIKGMAAEVGAATLEERRLAVHAHNTVNDLLRRARQAAGALVGA